MPDHKIITDCKDNMQKCIKSFEADLAKVRTGRASIAMLDGITVEYYGTQMPLNQVATLTTPDPRLIVISPFDKKMIQTIEKAIMVADIGVQPQSDGNVVRLPIPPLSEERRKDLCKNVKKLAEDKKVALRQIRRDANEHVKKEEKDRKITEDESKRFQADIQKQTDTNVALVDEKATKKEKEIMTM